MKNPLQEFPKVRQMVYRVLWVVTALMGAVQIFFAAMPELSAPSWMPGALAVLAYVSGFTNYTADQNVYDAEHAKPGLFARRGEEGSFDNSILLAVALVVAIVCMIVWLASVL